MHCMLLNRPDQIQRERAMQQLLYERDHFSAWLWGLAKPMLALFATCIVLGLAALTATAIADGGGHSGSAHGGYDHYESRLSRWR